MSLVKFGWLGKKVNWLRRYLIYGPRGDALLYVRRLNRMGARIDESLYMPAPETVFLDDRQENIDGAKRVGIHGICFASYEQAVQALRQMGVEC